MDESRGNGITLNCCYSTKIEPVGYKAPTFANDYKSFTFDRSSDASFALLCPAQAYPQPSFRYKVGNYLNIQIRA